jgi:hypothetical protein
MSSPANNKLLSGIDCLNENKRTASRKESRTNLDVRYSMLIACPINRYPANDRRFAGLELPGQQSSFLGFDRMFDFGCETIVRSV